MMRGHLERATIAAAVGIATAAAVAVAAGGCACERRIGIDGNADGEGDGAGDGGGDGGDLASDAAGEDVSCPPGTMDCDGECVDIASDPMNCGWCGHVCPALYEHMVALCVDSYCEYECAPGWTDHDGVSGCEAACMDSETCNYIDDDCDEVVDEGFDLDTDEANAAACGHGGAADNSVTEGAVAVCTSSTVPTSKATKGSTTR